MVNDLCRLSSLNENLLLLCTLPCCCSFSLSKNFLSVMHAGGNLHAFELCGTVFLLDEASAKADIRLRFSLKSCGCCCGAPSAECCGEPFILPSLKLICCWLEIGHRVPDLAVSHRLDHLHCLCTLTIS